MMHKMTKLLQDKENATDNSKRIKEVM